MELWEILVPCQWNTGKPVRTRHHKEWDKRVRKLSGGITILSPARGQWVNKGVLYEERVIPVRVACDRETILKIIGITAQHYRQLAVMAYKISSDVIIEHFEPEEIENARDNPRSCASLKKEVDAGR